MDRTIKIALGSLAFNLAFSAYHLIFGIVSESWWLLTLGTYYLFLSIVRFFVITYSKNPNVVKIFTGVMLMPLTTKERLRFSMVLIQFSHL